MENEPNPAAGLRTNQRNIWTYYLHHRKKYPAAPCFVPKSPLSSSQFEVWMRALDALEEKNLIRIDRSAAHYTGWIMLPANRPR